MITVPTFDYFGLEVQVVREKIDYVIQVDEYGNWFKSIRRSSKKIQNEESQNIWPNWSKDEDFRI